MKNTLLYDDKEYVILLKQGSQHAFDCLFKKYAKKVMSFEVTKLVHGEEEALKVKKASEEIFNNKGNSDNTETINLSKDILKEKPNVVDILMLSGIFESKSEIRRLIEQNGISINGVKVTSINMQISFDLLKDKALLIQKGKKKFIRITFN